MRKFVLFLLFIVPLSLFAENGFGIYVDDRTYEACKLELEAYRDQLISEGLHAKILHSAWRTPESVRLSIKELAMEKSHPLEGVVFIGDIPIAMIRGAQWMTTAFRADENSTDIFESSVASDRYYDDFDLEFDFVGEDKTRPGVFYYTLSDRGSQYLHPEIYSARIRVPQAMIEDGSDRDVLMRDYLNKVVRAHKEQNILDHMVYYFGCNYNSEDLDVWKQRPNMFREQFPHTFETDSGNNFLSFHQDHQMKWILFSELKREECDYFHFSCHGDPDIQYINNLEDVGLANNVDANTSIISQEELKERCLNPRIVVLNSCYNGAFHNSLGYVGGMYIFNKGRCIVTQGNTVNSLQDKWEDKLIGYLSKGIRVGFWQKEVSFLETHLIGDPTFRFSSSNRNDKKIAVRLENMLTNNVGDRNKWLNMINSKDAVERAAAITHLCDISRQGYDSLLIRKVSNCALAMLSGDESISVRMCALDVLRNMSDYNADSAICVAISDSQEIIARHACIFAWERAKAGRNNCVLAALTKICEADNTPKRVRFCATNAMMTMKDTDYLDEVLEMLNEGGEEQDVLSLMITFRVYHYSKAIPVLLGIAADPCKSEIIRKTAIEVLGWYHCSPYRFMIIHLLMKCLNDDDLANNVKKEIIKTTKRLQRI